MKTTVVKAALLAIVGAASLVLAQAQTLEAQHADAGKTQAIEERVSQYHLAGQFDGAVLVAFDGEVIYKGGFGQANREWDQPNDSDTRFYIASCTKSFTSTLVLMLAQDGLIDLDKPVSTYLQDLNPALGDKITIRHMLTHTSGLVRDWSEFTRDESDEACSSEAITQILSTTELLFEPGTEFSYSNSGYALLAALVESVTGLAYPQVLEQRILRPLQMNHTGVWAPSSIVSKRAVGYDPRLMCERLNVAANDAACGVGAGGLYSTVEDLYKFDRGLLGDTLLSAKSKEEAFKGQLGGYGMGWYISPFEIEGAQYKLIRHSGFAGGFGGVIWRMPAERHFIAILQNNSAVPWPLASDLLNILYDATEGMEPPATTIATTLICALLNEDVDSALELYRAMPQDDSRMRPTGPRQATGEPDSGPVDSDSSWASRTPDSQREWLLLDFGEPMRPTRIDVYENYNPGAIDRLSVFNDVGKEFDIPLSSAGLEKSPRGVSVLSVPVQIDFDTTRLKLYTNSPAIAGWNEIDAVAMVDADGQEHWAREARASSTGADGSPRISLTTVPDGPELNKLGHAYLELGQPDSALRVFEFNARAHPESIIAQQALADLLHRLGRSEQAGVAARRAQALENSEQSRVRDRLTRIQ